MKDCLGSILKILMFIGLFSVFDSLEISIFFSRSKPNREPRTEILCPWQPAFANFKVHYSPSPLSPCFKWSKVHYTPASLKICRTGTSLVAQWLSIHLPMQGARVRSLVWEDPTCREATKPVRHNYWACTLELASHNYWACVPQLLKPMLLEPVLHNKRSHRNEKPLHRNKE